MITYIFAQNNSTEIRVEANSLFAAECEVRELLISIKHNYPIAFTDEPFALIKCEGEIQSNCCNAQIIDEDCDLCPECKEHCLFEEVTDENV